MKKGTAMKLPVTILLSVLLVFASVRAVQAVPYFGTGVGFDRSFFSGFTGVTEGVAFGQIIPGQREVDVTRDNGFGQARARATATASAFSLGADADSIGAPFSRQAWSFAASGFTLTGTPQSSVRLNFALDGAIFPVAASGRVEAGNAALYIYAAGDGNGGPVAYAFLSTTADGGFSAEINDSNGLRSFPSGNHATLSLSAAIPGAGGPFLAALLADSHGGANVDFLSTATLTGADLLPGATLTLDTGQVFQSPLAVPEPGTLVLLAIGLAGLAAGRRRKTA